MAEIRIQEVQVSQHLLQGRCCTVAVNNTGLGYTVSTHCTTVIHRHTPATKSSWQTKSVLIPCDAITRILQSRKPTPGIHWENFTACVLWPVGPDRSAVSCVRNTRAHMNTRSLVNCNVKKLISLMWGGGLKYARWSHLRRLTAH